ncbi:hypothetical protein C8Q79DRAFT_1005241 [Trametes meyenii]|nr:hypothetical protein C8Q79DRAFT_1005241 [Trametes meyenii]
MFFGLYIHPRPVVIYEPRATRDPTTNPRVLRTTSLDCHHSRKTNKEAAFQEPLEAELQRANSGCVDDKRDISIAPPQEPYYTENVAEALRRKQRMKARQALNSAATVNLPLLSPMELHSPEQPIKTNDNYGVGRCRAESAPSIAVAIFHHPAQSLATFLQGFDVFLLSGAGNGKHEYQDYHHGLRKAIGPATSLQSIQADKGGVDVLCCGPIRSGDW